MSTKRKIFVTIAVLVTCALAGSLGTFAAFTARTTNTGNSVSSGTVKVDQHPGATTLYDVQGQRAGATQSSCVRVTYGGTLAAAMRLYASSGITDGSFFNLRVERGSGLTSPAASMSCNGFNPSSTLFDDSLSAFQTNYTDGYDAKSSGAWTQNESVDYRFTITVKDNTTPNAMATSRATGSHTFTWEARNN